MYTGLNPCTLHRVDENLNNEVEVFGEGMYPHHIYYMYHNYCIFLNIYLHIVLYLFIYLFYSFIRDGCYPLVQGRRAGPTGRCASIADSSPRRAADGPHYRYL